MGCTNSKERPRTPPPDAALQSAVSDGDGFWAANGEKRASREAPAPPNPSETKADATTTTEASAPKPSPTKPPAIKPVMPGGRKKSNKKKKGKKGKSKK